MKDLHPIKLIAEPERKYKVQFQGRDGAREYTFQACADGLDGFDLEFMRLTESDAARQFLFESICFFDSFRQAKPLKDEEFPHGLPISLEFKGESEAETFKYVILFEEHERQQREEVFHLHYAETSFVIRWRTGECRGALNQRLYLEIDEPKPGFWRLLNSILMFDESRYVRGGPNELPMRIALP